MPFTVTHFIYLTDITCINLCRENAEKWMAFAERQRVSTLAILRACCSLMSLWGIPRQSSFALDDPAKVTQ